MLRIRADRDDNDKKTYKITWGRAAIIKAYYLKNPHTDCPEEVLTVSLNEASTDTAYTLGRLFSVYEAVQQAANPGINATIKDKYFNSAAAMPASWASSTMWYTFFISSLGSPSATVRVISLQ